MALTRNTDDLENDVKSVCIHNQFEKVKCCFITKNLENPVLAKRLVVENIDLRDRISQFEKVGKEYQNSQILIARYEEREKKNWAYAIFRDFFMTLSGVFFGLISHDFSRENPFNWIMLVLAIIILMEVILSYYLPYMKKKGGVVWIYQ